MSRGDTSLIRRLVPTKIMFDLYRVGNTNQLEHNSRSPCNTPFFSNGYIEFESGAITTKLLRNDPKTLLVDFTSFCTKGHVTFETVVFTLDNFIKQLESIIDRKTDFIYIDVNVSTDWKNEYDCPSYGSCPKKEICKNINKNSSYYKGSSTCVIQFNLNQVKKALAVYHGIEENEGGFSMKGAFGKLGLEFGINKDPRIRSTLTGIAVQNPSNNKWYVFDPATHTRKDMMNFKFGNFPIALIPVKSLTVGKLTKHDGKYYWVQSLDTVNNTFTGVNAMTGAVETFVLSESLIPGFNFYTEVVAFDAKTLMDPSSKQNMGGNLLGAMLMMQAMKTDKAEFSLDDINDDSFNGLGSFLPLLMMSKDSGLGITKNDGTPDIMSMMALMSAGGGEGDLNEIFQISLLSNLLGGGNTANPFGNLMNGIVPGAATPAEESATGSYICTKCGKKYSDPAIHFCTECGGKVIVSGTACPKCGAILKDGAKFCHVCGTKVGPATCPKCGKEVPEGAKFCPSCGTDLAPAPAPAPTPAPEPAPAPAPAPEK